MSDKGSALARKSGISKEVISQNGIWLVLIGLAAIMSIANPNFLTVDNLTTLLTGEATKGILAFGIMFAICIKGNDLSAGSVVAFVGAITAALVQPADYGARILGFGPLPTGVAILIGLCIGAIIGIINGSLIAYTKMPAFIATLGTQLICRAGAKLFANRPVSNLPDSFRFFGSGRIGNFPVIILCFIVMFVIAGILLTQTRFGKNVFAVGGNDQAARVAGINVEWVILKVHIWCSLCAAIGGILLAGRAGSVDPSSTGLNYEFDAIAAATIGGTSHAGGVCRISGVLCGILILGVINNGLVMMKVDDNMTNVIKGVIIVVSVALDMRKNARKV